MKMIYLVCIRVCVMQLVLCTLLRNYPHMYTVERVNESCVNVLPIYQINVAPCTSTASNGSCCPFVAQYSCDSVLYCCEQASLARRHRLVLARCVTQECLIEWAERGNVCRYSL